MSHSHERGVWRVADRLANEYGLAVFPLATGAKIPAISKDDGGNGCLDATTHPEQLALWNDRYPRANVGIATGGISRLYVIDFDRPDALAEFTARYGVRPRTVTVNTPKPGRHEYYRTPQGATLPNTASRLLKGVDTRGHNGYVVAPPSRLSDGRCYTFADGCAPWDVEIAPLPDAILAELTRSTCVPPASAERRNTVPRDASDITARVAAYIRRLPSLRDGEGRHATGYRLSAFVQHDCGGSTVDAAVALNEWNRRNSEPLSETDLESLITDAKKYGGRRVA